MNTGGHEKTVISVSIIILSFMALLLLITGTGAVAEDSGQQASVHPTPTNLTMTNISSVNHTVPAHQPDLVLTNGQIELRETLLPSPKGDLAVGPRRINLLLLAVLVLTVGAVTAGTWYILKRIPGEDSEGIPDDETGSESPDRPDYKK